MTYFRLILLMVIPLALVLLVAIENFLAGHVTTTSLTQEQLNLELLEFVHVIPCALHAEEASTTTFTGYKKSVDFGSGTFFVAPVMSKYLEDQFCFAGFGVAFRVFGETKALESGIFYQCRINFLASTDEYVAVTCKNYHNEE